MMKKSFEKSFKLTKLALAISGIQICFENKGKITTFFSNYLYNINIICLYTVIFGEIYWVLDGIQTGRAFIEISMTSPCITISILGTVKSIFLYLNTETITTIINKLREIHPEFNTDEAKVDVNEVELKEDRIVKESTKFLNFVTNMLTSISVVVVTMFCLMPILTIAYDYLKNDQLIIKYPYLVKYSFDVYQSDYWILVYFHQIWATVIVCMNVFGTDTLFYILCTYFAMHFRLLGNKFEGMVASNPMETRRNLITGIKRHQELINLVDLTEHHLFSKAMLCNIVASSVLICLSAFNVTVAEDVSTTLPFVAFLMMSLAQICLLCIFGDMLMRSSGDINGAVYKSSWYDVEQDLKKYVLLVIIRAQKPCKLTAAGFADLNLKAFTTILSRSWSYFALLKTVYNSL